MKRHEEYKSMVRDKVEEPHSTTSI